MRTVYLGTTDFAAVVLGRLAESEHRPSLVVTRPDRPRGRGRRLAAPPVAGAARELGLALDQPEDVNAAEARERIAAEAPEAVCICAFGALIREPLLGDHAWLNVHPSLLPRWRGAAPVERAIEAGDERTGVTIMRPTAELDAGPTCLQGDEPIEPGDDYGTLSARLAELGGRLLVEVLDTRPPFSDQPEAGVTYAEKIEASDRLLHPSLPAELLERRVRALRPHIGASVEHRGERLGVRRARPAGGGGPSAGELTDDGGRLLYGTADGALELLEVLPAGKRTMNAQDFLSGRPLD